MDSKWGTAGTGAQHGRGEGGHDVEWLTMRAGGRRGGIARSKGRARTHAVALLSLACRDSKLGAAGTGAQHGRGQGERV
jgi:hypothetical protein